MGRKRNSQAAAPQRDPQTRRHPRAVPAALSAETEQQALKCEEKDRHPNNQTGAAQDDKSREVRAPEPQLAPHGSNGATATPARGGQMGWGGGVQERALLLGSAGAHTCAGRGRLSQQGSWTYAGREGPWGKTRERASHPRPRPSVRAGTATASGQNLVGDIQQCATCDHLLHNVLGLSGLLGSDPTGQAPHRGGKGRPGLVDTQGRPSLRPTSTRGPGTRGRSSPAAARAGAGRPPLALEAAWGCCSREHSCGSGEGQRGVGAARL